MLKQALQMTWRDWRSGEMRLLMVAVFLAVAAICAVGFFADRLNSSLSQNAKQLIGGDVVIVSDQPLPEEFYNQAENHQLKTTRITTLVSMARTSDTVMADGTTEFGKTNLVSLKSVDDNYPLRGELYIKSSHDAPLLSTQQGPNAGEAWVAPELLISLGLNVGDHLLLGEASLPITQLLVLEPDGTTEGFVKMGPRVMINSADLAATELLQPASRANYRFAVIGETGAPQEVSAFEAWSKDQIESNEQADSPMRGMRMETLETGQPIMQNTLERAQKFLNLVALLAALLSAVAVVIAARDFARRHLDDCAMLRVFGVPQRHITFLYFFEFAVAGFIAALTGVAAGYALHYVFVVLLAQLIGTELPAASFMPVIYGVGVGMTLLLSFGLPPVLQLAKVPPLRVLRKDLGGLPATALSILALGTLGFVLLLIAISDDITLGLITVGGFALAIILFALLAYLLAILIKPLANISALPAWARLAVRSITTRPKVLMMQVSALSVGLLALLLLFLLRTDLIASWQQATPKDAPDRFVINIMPDQATPFKEALDQAGITQYDWFPMILGRITHINDTPASADNYTNHRAQRLINREFSLSYDAQRPTHNKILEGEWIEGEEGSISAEAGLMETLGLKLGDNLSFNIGGINRTAKITSVREVDWASMHVNFFLIFPVAEVGDIPQTFITSFKAPEDLYFDNQLTHTFPNVTNINASAMLQQVQMVLDQVIQAVEFIFAFTLVAGLVVLYAAIYTTREQRAHDFAVMRALGASNKLLRQVQRAELMSTGAIAGFVASLVALAISGALVIFVFEFTWSPTLWTPLLGAAIGLLLTWAIGWLSLRSVLKRPVIETLRAVLD